jgi:hypothetical protein
MHSYRIPRWCQTVLLVTTVLLFLGQAWQHWRWDVPFRALMWNQTLMQPLIESFTALSWSDYVTSGQADSWVQGITLAFSLFYLVAAIATVLLRRLPRFATAFLIAGSLALSSLALLYTLDRFFYAGMFLEYSLMWTTPLFFLLLMRRDQRVPPRLIWVMKGAIAFTFVGHGLFALGVYPMPVHFMEMTLNILPITESAALTFLFVAGILDLLVGVGVFIPGIDRPALFYAAIWGLLTSLARIWSYFDINYMASTLDAWLFESLIRLPHAVIPLVLFVILTRARTSR